MALVGIGTARRHRQGYSEVCVVHEGCDPSMVGETRRVAKDGDTETLRWGERLSAVLPAPHHQGLVVAVYRKGRRLWAEGHTYALQPGRGKHAVGRITAIRYSARAGVISEHDAHAEGFDSAADFRTYYAALNGAASLDTSCWALSFHLIEDEEEE